MLLESILQSAQGDCQPFRFDRRESSRWTLPGSASVIALGTELGATFELECLKGAPWWMSGISMQAPPCVGTTVSVGFSDPAFRHARAVVMRIDELDDCVRVALRFEDALVA
ncbi:MAG: hypothetical protein EXS10_00025 [Phycisphaerales bacterium]|nr:hypothetical protein [Phycisphaerales bacterium]